ncbi:cation:proton antiporter [Candidatus Contubernalis alkaliaceticus]|uniref:cation:proton antiporter n=1 Tax=Candidatus Contubernalis alkaliaceticus TaxID=338645 RepID=UPI001F4C4C07|nr:cation:proton antiporter [Candidatus Contubernalis alkalaceticus]UNC92687.1 cation:proton antiporter [Candidatus Contubernalis alkalaceticus]
MAITDQILGVGVLLILGYAGGQLAKKAKLPAVAGYCLTGILLSPSVFNIIPYDLNMELEALKVLGLSMIAMIIGGELNLRVLKKIGKSIVVITFAQIFTTLLIVFLGMFLLMGKDLSVALIMAAMATATAPAATLAVMKEYKSKGKFSTTLLGVIALDDALCIILVGFALAFAKGLMEMGATFEIADLAHPAWELAGSLGLGFFTGLILSFVLKYIQDKHETIVILLAFVLINSGISTYLDLSSLLVNMVSGAVVANLYLKNPVVINVLDDIDLPIFVIFFTLAGASLHLDLLLANWFPALIYIITRALGKISGCYYGALISGADAVVRKYMGFAMLPKAGVSIGLILFVQSRFPGTELAALVTAIELAAVTFYEIIGPLATRYALMGAGEVSISTGKLDSHKMQT